MAGEVNGASSGLEFSQICSQLLRFLALLSLSGLCFILGTRWATRYEEVLIFNNNSNELSPQQQQQQQQQHHISVVETEAEAENVTLFPPPPIPSPPPNLPYHSDLINEEGSLNPLFGADGTPADGEEESAATADDEENFLKSSSNPLSTPPSGGVAKTTRLYKFEVCPPNMKELVPCLDNTAAIASLPSSAKGEKWERHCPREKAARFCCLIAAPTGWRYPVRWPRSRDEVWYGNVPHTKLVEYKGGQNWITIKNDKFIFPGGGTQFPHGADQYIDQMAKMVPDIKFGAHTRVALDIGCGVASWGAYSLSRDVLPLSIAPKDVHENQIQFALERGVPAMIAVLATRRLLYPSQAFDLIHCSRCRIEWVRDGGMLLLEADRVLRAGGYFAWAAQPVYKHEGNLPEEWHAMEDLASRIGWTLVAKEGYIAIWQKPSDYRFYVNRANVTQPPLCDQNDDPNEVWYVPMKACLTRLPEGQIGRNVSDWPARLHEPPRRLHNLQIDSKMAKEDVFIAEQRYWHEVVKGYLRGLGIKKEEVRNVMDMRASYGGFATALVDEKADWWVMNVVPVSGVNTLPIIYDRGLIGVAHDWCESFDTYPRTYDLLHVSGLFVIEEKRCDMAHIFIEMDRILRPGGWVLIRESFEMAEKVEVLAKSMRWTTRVLPTESGPFGKDKLISCRKQLWHN